MTKEVDSYEAVENISTPMPLAGHDFLSLKYPNNIPHISTPMPLAGHDLTPYMYLFLCDISTPMPLAGHDRCPY